MNNICLKLILFIIIKKNEEKNKRNIYEIK